MGESPEVKVSDLLALGRFETMERRRGDRLIELGFTMQKETLQQLIRGEVYDTPKILDQASRDASIFTVRPSLVIAPKDTTDIQKLIQYINEHPDEKLSLTPRLAGTDMSGGPLTESIVLDMKKHFTKIESVTSSHVVCQPGVMYKTLERAAKKKDALYPAYTSSKDICTIGGMIADNAGGEKSLSYGKAERYVEELEVVLADGTLATFRPLTVAELPAKFQLPGLEGDIYRKMYALIRENYVPICQAKPTVSKNSAGYYLWNVWDGTHFDLTKLLVGSQGTLGIITKMKLKLVRPKKHSRLLVIFLSDTDKLATIINKVLEHRPESFECFDDHTLTMAIKYLPELSKHIARQSPLKTALNFLPEAFFFLRHGMPKLVLLASFTSDKASDATKQALVAETAIKAYSEKTLVTKTKIEEKKYWVVRRESFNLLRHHSPDKHAAPFIDDITVAPAKLPKFLPKLKEIMSHYAIEYTLAGHIGDGNFHIIPLLNMHDTKITAIIPEVSKKVFDLVFQYGGSMSGEHNDGLIRTPYLTAMFGPEMVSLFATTKAIFDPNNIFNPGKKVAVSLQYSLQHLIKD